MIIEDIRKYAAEQTLAEEEALKRGMEVEGVRGKGRGGLHEGYAAIYFINKAGSSRQTVNGWAAWRTESGKLLSDLREQFLKEHPTR